MEINSTLYKALTNFFPQMNEEISAVFRDHQSSGSGNTLRADSFSGVPFICEQKDPNLSGFPEKEPADVSRHFNQLTEALKEIIGPKNFLSFINHYLKTTESNDLIKSHMAKMEKQIQELEVKESEKFQALNLQMPVLYPKPGQPQYSHASLKEDIKEEFKNAKWIVLTSPLIQQKPPRGAGGGVTNHGSSLNREGSLSISNQAAAGPGNIAIQISSLGQNSNRLQLTNSTQQALNASVLAQAKLAAQAPQKRYAHSACLVKNKMYVFGGMASKQKGGNYQTFFECTLKFSGSSAYDDNVSSSLLFSWDKIKAEAPKARDSHTCVHIGDAMIMFGGSGGNYSFNDLYKFDMRSQKWTKLEPLGELPSPREGHTAKVIGQDKMMVHGGVDQSEKIFNDTYVLTGINPYISNEQTSSIYLAYLPMYSEEQRLAEMNSLMQQENNNHSMQVSETESILPNLDTSIVPVSQPQVASGAKPQTGKGRQQKLRWHKCRDEGQVPQGRDSHTSALINNKVYIFGGQGDGDVIFDDLYSVEILETTNGKGELEYVAKWTEIEPQTPKNQKPLQHKPRARTSHSCSVYKNRYLIVVGGEGEFDDSELEVLNRRRQDAQRRFKEQSSAVLSKKGSIVAGEEDNICVELDNEVSSESQQDGDAEVEKRAADGETSSQRRENCTQSNNKRPLSDVWAYDTLMNRWHEIFPGFKIQGNLTGKKIKKEFEPRMAHSAVALDQFVVLFGGLGTDQTVSNDLYVLCLDGNLSQIGLSIEPETSQEKQNSRNILTPSVQQQQQDTIQIPMLNPFPPLGGAVIERTQSAVVSNTVQIPLGNSRSQKNNKEKAIKSEGPLQVASAPAVASSSIVNYTSGQTNQYFISGGTITNNIYTTNGLSHFQASNEPSSNCQLQQPQKRVEVAHTEAQTLSLEEAAQELPFNPQSKLDAKSQLVLIMKQNDYKLSAFQRTKFSFVKSIAEQISWPLQCFGALIDNSIEAFEIAKAKGEALKSMNQGSASSFSISQQQQHNSSLEIEINLKLNQLIKETSSLNGWYLEVKDNGPGMHPKALMETLTSFGASQRAKLKSAHQNSEHGIGLKISSFRLASSTLIITKTRPVLDCGTSSFFLSFGLLSSEFMKHSSSSTGHLIAPIVSVEIRNKRISKKLTPEPEHFLNLISQYTKAKFENGDKLLQYGLNIMNEQGGTHIFMFNLTKQRPTKQGPESHEVILSEREDSADIVLNQTIFGPQSSSPLDHSLSTYLKFIYLEYPEGVKIRVNGRPVETNNPYSTAKKYNPAAFSGEKKDRFALQLLNKDLIRQNMNIRRSESEKISQAIAILSSQIATLNPEQDQAPIQAQIAQLTMQGSENSQIMKVTESTLKEMEGVLVYRGNRLIRRMEHSFGDGEDNITSRPIHAIVSAFNSKSGTTLDKSDFSDKQIIKQIKEWYKSRLQIKQESCGDSQDHTSV